MENSPSSPRLSLVISTLRSEEGFPEGVFRHMLGQEVKVDGFLQKGAPEKQL